MTYRIPCAAIALALVLIASPLWAGPDSDFGPQSLESISEALESFTDPFTAGVDGEDEMPGIAVAGRLLLPWGRNDDGR